LTHYSFSLWVSLFVSKFQPFCDLDGSDHKNSEFYFLGCSCFFKFIQLKLKSFSFFIGFGFIMLLWWLWKFK
jgi:hypothetical protein